MNSAQAQLQVKSTINKIDIATRHGASKIALELTFQLASETADLHVALKAELAEKERLAQR